MSPARMLILALWGACAVNVWTFGYALLFQQAYLAAGSPNPPTRVWFNFVTVVICAVLGFACGAIVPLLARRPSVVSWTGFWLGCMSALIAVAFIFAHGLTTVLGHFHLVGTYAFFGGTLLAAVATQKLWRDA